MAATDRINMLVRVHVSNKPARAAGNIPQYTIGAALASIVLSVAKNPTYIRSLTVMCASDL